MGVVFILLAGVPACPGAAYSAYQYYETDGEDDNADFYDSYNEEIQVPTEITTVLDALARIKRYGDRDEIRTLNPEEIIDVKGALNKILNGNKPVAESLRAEQPAVREYTDIYDYVEKSNVARKWSPNYDVNPSIGVQHWSPTVGVQHWNPDIVAQRGSPTIDVQHSSPTVEVQKWSPNDDSQETMVYQEESSTYSKDYIQADVRKMMPIREEVDAVPRQPNSFQHWSPADVTEVTVEESSTYNSDNIQAEVQRVIPREQNIPGIASSIEVQHWSPTIGIQHWRPSGNLGTSTYSKEEVRKELQNLMPSERVLYQELTSTMNVLHWNPALFITPRRWNPVVEEETLPITNEPSIATETTVADHPTFYDEFIYMRQGGNSTPPSPSPPTSSTSTTTTTATTTSTSSALTTTTSTTSTSASSTSTSTSSTSTSTSSTSTSTSSTSTPTTTTTTTTTKTTTPHMDINAIIAIIANLTYDYEWNLTEEFNKTLIDHGVPFCPTGTTISTTSTTPSPYDFANTSVVGKCFVCGLKTPEIPRSAHCADAFAGDFLPLMPTDARARGQIATYRKYCRHLDVHNYVENPLEPRSIYGRFTGGCGVRWTDLTGIYTQRTCRARFRPLMGKHFASKRMAKLELSLVNVENGCIISPMATLLPLSRGVSLYARFHACVCTGSWCNTAAHARPARALCGALLLLLYWLDRYT